MADNLAADPRFAARIRATLAPPGAGG